MGVVCALEIARLDRELGLGLPLRIFAFAEEEGSGFGEVLLGSRAMTGACTEADLRERFRDEHGVSFWDAAIRAGHRPDRLSASARHLDGLQAWIEIHIEQARQLEAAGLSLGNVTVIAGCIQGDLVVTGRADHAGATPMALRRDAFAGAAAVSLELERLAGQAGDGTVATVGAVSIEPGQRTTVPARVILEIDARSTGDGHAVVVDQLLAYAREVADVRGLEVAWRLRQRREPRPLDDRVRAALTTAAEGRWQMLDLASGAVHDTMLVAERIPAGLVFIPCEDGRSHTPDERADPRHAAQAVAVVLQALVALSRLTMPREVPVPDTDFGGSGAVAPSLLTRRPARTDSLDEQRTGTLLRAQHAIAGGDLVAATTLLNFALDGECAFIRDLMVGWRTGLRELSLEEGMSEQQLEAEGERLRVALSLDGTAPYDEDQGWTVLRASFQRALSAIAEGAAEPALERVRETAAQWRAIHDREIDLTYGLMSLFARFAGEASVPRMFERIGAHHLDEFYALGDPSLRAWDEGGYAAIVLDTIEAMRGHLSSGARDGRPFEMTEYEDRVEMRFDPCGSGGRAVRGDVVEGTGSRLREPYDLGVVEGAYDWTDGKAGLCVYCTHCLMLYEQAPIDRAGWPFLVVDPPAPSLPADERRCQYTIYKRPEDVPDEVYERSGRTKPARPTAPLPCDPT